MPPRHTPKEITFMSQTKKIEPSSSSSCDKIYELSIPKTTEEE